MANKPIEFHEQASEEFGAAVDWYVERSPLAALRFVQEVERAVEKITEAPHRWPGHLHNTRKFVLQHFPFALIYRELPSVIQVLAVSHGHRHPGYWKTRL